ncbi:sodium-coupled monocarboxylate transporter 1-like [Acanthaster planci]|uniref:Sodium-coupled monocarboxylate transporter 1-like n=1 Tax=Acanthaster planci TaxID=133434 RepID=A0A8B7Y8R2_ACAPL|nr:sodium-coupled monocarboxylate transporter 1-like [Acanthaster planci]
MQTPTGERHAFQAADYAVCGSMLLASLAIGFYYGLRGGRQHTSAEYILANRRMTVVPVTLSLLASYFSGISLQGMPSDVYFRGTMGVWAAAPVVFSGFISLYFFVPLYYNMGITSVFEYLELRFNRAVLACGVFAFIFFAILYMGLVTFAVCVAATAVTSVSYSLAVVCLVGVCTVYTVIGGMKAVLWTDTLQMLVIFSTIIIVIIKGNFEMGGIENVWRIAEKGQRIQLLNTSPDPTEYYTVWGLLIGQLGTAATVHISNQYMVQRYLACKSLNVAKTTLSSVLNGVAALLGEHLVKPCWKTLSDERYTLVLKIIATVFALVTFGMAFLVPLMGSVTPAAFASYVVGAAVGVWLGVGNIIHGGPSDAELPLSTEGCDEMNVTTETVVTQYVMNGFVTEYLNSSLATVEPTVERWQ